MKIYSTEAIDKFWQACTHEQHIQILGVDFAIAFVQKFNVTNENPVAYAEVDLMEIIKI